MQDERYAHNYLLIYAHNGINDIQIMINNMINTLN